MNVAGHLACTMLVYAIGARRLRLAREAAMTAAALFLLHPFHDQAVLWIAGRTDVLCTVFALAAFLLATRGERAASVAGAVAFALALAAKEMAATLPFVVFAFAWFFGEGGRHRRVVGALRLSLPLVVVLVVFMAWRTAILGGLGGDAAFRTLDVAALKSTAKLLGWLFVPWDFADLKADLRRNQALLYAASVLWLLALVIAVRALRAVRPALFAALWVALTLIPVHGRPHAWYLYLPSVGAAFLMAAVLQTAIPNPAPRRIVATALAVVFAATLHVNARGMAAAARIVDDAVGFFARQPSPAYLLNAPIALRGRMLTLTSEEQYALALSQRGQPVRVIPLNYVYVGSTAEPRTETAIGAGRIDLAVETGPDTFFTLEGVFVSPPSRPAQGLVRLGPHATYLVSELDTQGKIRRLSLTDLPAEVTAGTACLAEFHEGVFRPITGCAD